MRKNLLNYVKAGYSALYVVTHEEVRAQAEFRAVAKEADYRLFAWSVTSGLTDTDSTQALDCNDPVSLFAAVMDDAQVPQRSIVLLRDFHMFLDTQPEQLSLLVRLIKDAVAHARDNMKRIVIIACRKVLPPELEKEFVLLDFSLPGKDELEHVLDDLCKANEVTKPKGKALVALLDAASGMTTAESENAFSLSLVKEKKFDPELVGKEKSHAVAKSGLLEIIEDTRTVDDIGGLDDLKGWVTKRANAFTDEARKYGLPMPKGALIVGIPGTGKSLTAKATSSILKRPILKLDAGKLFGSLVGESEGNVRAAIQTAEAVAPCVLWIDEIEKGFSGSKSSGTTDGGTSSRVFGTFISWMQDKTAPVFVVATANDISQLPPEMLRKGRFDEMFFVDLPNDGERCEIWRIQLQRYKRTPDKFDIGKLVNRSQSMTGSEIEQAVVEAMFNAYDEGREVETADIMSAMDRTVPLSITMSEQLNALRKWAENRCRNASAKAKQSKGRKVDIR